MSYNLVVDNDYISAILKNSTNNYIGSFGVYTSKLKGFFFKLDVSYMGYFFAFWSSSRWPRAT